MHRKVEYLLLRSSEGGRRQHPVQFLKVFSVLSSKHQTGGSGNTLSGSGLKVAIFSYVSMFGFLHHEVKVSSHLQSTHRVHFMI